MSVKTFGDQVNYFDGFAEAPWVTFFSVLLVFSSINLEMQAVV